MSLDNVRQFQRTSFFIPRYTDTEIIAKLTALAKDGGYKAEKSTYQFLISDQQAEFTGFPKDGKLEELLAIGSVTTRNITLQLNGWFEVVVERPFDHQQRKVTGTQDVVTISPVGQQNANQTVINFAKAIGLARKHFGAVDTKPLLDYLDEGTKQLYQSREQDLQKLERMQESFFQNLTEFTLDQQKKQQDFTRELESQYVARQKTLEEQHRDRLNQ